MSTRRKAFWSIGSAAAAWAVCGVLVGGQPKQKEEEQERQVKESEVPKAALDTLKKMANGATITEFSEEIEHGVTYYEGSWKGAGGHIDVLVTAAGDLVEIEEAVSMDSVPKAVLAKSRELAGKDAALRFEKKTYISYEVKFRKGDRRHEVLIGPDGRTHEHEEEGAQEGVGDKDD